jgi:hypothetical protein
VEHEFGFRVSRRIGFRAHLGSAVNRLEAKFMLGSHGDSDDGVEDLWVECENDPRFDVEAPACAVRSASRVVLHQQRFESDLSTAAFWDIMLKSHVSLSFFLIWSEVI